MVGVGSAELVVSVGVVSVETVTSAGVGWAGELPSDCGAGVGGSTLGTLAAVASDDACSVTGLPAEEATSLALSWEGAILAAAAGVAADSGHCGQDSPDWARACADAALEMQVGLPASREATTSRHSATTSCTPSSAAPGRGRSRLGTSRQA